MPVKKETPLESGILKIEFLFYWVYSTKTTMISCFYLLSVLPKLVGFKSDIELEMGLKAKSDSSE